MAMHDPINRMVMEEIGLTITPNKVVIDQDTRSPVLLKDKVLKYSSQTFVPVRPQEQVFDPAANKGQMNMLFEYFIGKLESEGCDVDMYYDIHNGSAMEAKVDGRTIQTNDYNNEQLKFVDMMRQLNGSETDDISKLDIKKKKTTKSRRSKLDFNR